MTQRIYLDNAASTPMREEILAVMMPYLYEVYGNPSSTHAHGRTLRAAIEKARKTVAQCLNATPSEIFFTAGGTEADNAIISGAVEKFGLTHIVSTRIEHHAVTHTIEHLEKTGKVTVTWLNVDSQGHISLSELEDVLRNAPRTLVSLMHANNEIGTMIDIAAVGEVCKTYNALFHSDTVQTMGHFAYDVQALNVHYMTGAAHKFYGPKGIGFMFVRAGAGFTPLIHGGSQERNMRAGTENVAGIVGLAHALSLCCENLAAKNEHLWELKSYMIAQLTQQFEGVKLNGDTSKEGSLPTVLNVSFKAEDDLMLIFNLDIMGVSVSGGSACTSGSEIGSHVLSGIQLPDEYAKNAVRFSFGIQNTKAEIDAVVNTLKDILKVPA